MPELSKVGWGCKPDDVEQSVKEGIEEMKLPLTKKADGPYITFENVEFKRDASASSTTAIKEAVTFQKSILTKIYGNVVEVDGNKRSVKERHIQLGQLPQLLEGRNTFMVTGSEYNLINQPRRKSSVYIYSDSGSVGTAVADFNLAKGRNFDLSMDDKTGQVVMNIGGGSVAIRPMLESLGFNRMDLVQCTDEQFARDHWDAVDAPQTQVNNYRKLYGKLYEFKQEDIRSIPLEDLKKGCKEYFEQTAVDPKTTKYLFSDSYKKIDKNFMKEILKKFYEVNAGEEDGIDPDDLYYQKLYPPNMLFKDRLQKVTNEIANGVRHKIKLGHTYSKIFNNIFSKYLVGMVNASDLSRLDPQYNPIGMYVASTKVSPLGMGGISDVEAVTRAKRGVHSSYFGIIDPTASAQGMNVGIQLNLTDDVKIDKSGEIYVPLADTKGNVKDIPIADTYDKKILVPEVPSDTNRYVMQQGKMRPLKKGEHYDYKLPHGTSSLFNTVNQLVPFPQATQGNRSFMTARQITQAVPLKYGETPLVEPVDDKGVSTYRKMRKDLESLLPMESPYNGTVTKVGDGKITLKDENGKKQEIQYHEYLPFATNTGVNQTPLVKPGDKIKKGQMVIKDGYTTDDGKLALGKNLKLAFMPYYGENSEDGIVISESCADKLTSLHYHTFNSRINDNFILDKQKFMNMFGSKYQNMIDFDRYDENGVIKKGEVVKYHDPVLLIIERRTPDDRIAQLGKISNKIVVDLVDGTQLYETMTEGKVVDVAKKKGFVSVTVVSEDRAVVGDKLTGMYGNKGTISKIIPDDQMIRDESGQPIDLIHSSIVVTTRINPGQVYENALGKIVASGKKKEPYKVPVAKNPTPDNLYDFTAKELKKYGIKDKEILFDPTTGKNIERPIAVGEAYFMKLLKGDKDLSARGVGPSYSYAGTPSKGGHEGAKGLGASEFNALVAHNARAFLTDAGNVKSQKNDEYWKGMEMGIPVPTKATSGTWEQTKGLLTAAGGYVTQDSNSISIMPITDKLTNQLAQHRTVQTPALLNSKDLEPMKKGLFDTATTGGLNGKLWSKLDLEDGIISPMVSGHLRLVLGKSEAEMKSWQANSTTKEMKKELDSFDINGRIKELTAKSKKNDLSNNEIKELRFLKNTVDRGEKLSDYVITSIPVPPPVMRPITKLQDGGVQVSDVNLFYKDIMLANEGLKSVKGTDFAPDAKKVLLGNIGALVGTEETSNIQLKKKGSRGVLPYLGGVGSPKNGYVQSTLVKKNQDLSGRARIIADASLSMDEIGIPEVMAWKMFEPHIMNELKKVGVPPLEATQMMNEHAPQARKALEDVANSMNVLYNRAPTLHRFGMLAAHPKIIPDTSIHLNLTATKPLNADFDGDAIQVHVPSNTRVSRSLDKMLLSKNIFSDVHPGALTIGFLSETVLGLYQMSQKDPKKFKKDMEEILQGTAEIPIPCNKKAANKILAETARNDPEHASERYTKIQNLGTKYATEIGSTVGIDDIRPMTKERDSIINKYSKLLDEEKDMKKRASILQAAQNEAKDAAKKHPGDLRLNVESGAKGSDMQLASIVVSPVLSYDPDKPVQTAVMTKGSYGEGLNMYDFWQQNIKVKKDAIATALNVATPGAMVKLMSYNVMKEVITMEDCGTDAGVEMDWNSDDILGRVIQESVPGIKKGSVITTENQSKLPHRKILVRAPKTCAAKEGVCQKCYGTDSYWKFLDIGTNVGLRAAYGINEPISQKALDSKHGGRDITRDVGGGGLQKLTNVFSSDSSKPTVATLSEQDDVVSEVQVKRGAPTMIYMESGKKYRVHPSSEVIVKPGDKVKFGDKLTEGILPYTDVTRMKGIKAGRDALIEDLRQLTEGLGVSDRLLDVVAKGAVNYVEVMSAFDSYLPGDTIAYNTLLDLGKKKGVPMKPSELKPGMSLAEEVGEYSAGTRITQPEIDDYFKKCGKKTILMFPEDVRVRPAVKSFYTSGMLEGDWVGNLAQKYIKRTLTEAAAEGKVSPAESISPVTPWITGRPFKETGPKY